MKKRTQKLLLGAAAVGGAYMLFKRQECAPVAGAVVVPPVQSSLLTAIPGQVTVIQQYIAAYRTVLAGGTSTIPGTADQLLSSAQAVAVDILERHRSNFDSHLTMVDKQLSSNGDCFSTRVVIGGVQYQFMLHVTSGSYNVYRVS